MNTFKNCAEAHSVLPIAWPMEHQKKGTDMPEQVMHIDKELDLLSITNHVSKNNYNII
jgi:hypothetical protein